MYYRDPPTKQGFYSRKELARALGISYWQVRRLQHKHVIAGEFERATGVWWFTEQDLTNARLYVGEKSNAKPLRAGTLAASAFALFDQGAGHREIVRTLRITPLQLAELWKQYESGGFIFDLATAQKVQEVLKTCGLRARSAAELVDCLERLASRHHKLRRLELANALRSDATSSSSSNADDMQASSA